jgi:hypothetical protein
MSTVKVDFLVYLIINQKQMNKKNEKKPGLRLGKQDGISGHITSLYQLHGVLEVASISNYKIIRLLKDPKKVYYFYRKDNALEKLGQEFCDALYENGKENNIDQADIEWACEDVMEELYKLADKYEVIIHQK